MKFSWSSAGLVTLGAMGLALAACGERNRSDTSHRLPSLTVGIQSSPAMALVMVAENEGFFKKAGLDVKLTQFTAGKFAMQAFLGGSLDVAVTGEVPVTLATLQGNRFKVIGQVVERTINEVRVVARVPPRTDVSHYFVQKRRLATSIGGGPEFYTYSFLQKYKVPAANVQIVAQRPEDMPSALAAGSVDAISIFDPFAAIAELRLGNKVQTFTDSSLYSELYTIDVKQQMLAGNNTTRTRAFLKGLRMAQDFVASRPEDAKRDVMTFTKLPKDVVDRIWRNYVFKVSLNNLFVQYTSAEAKWAIEKGTFRPDSTIPDYRGMIAPDLLREIAPSQVTL